MRMTIAAQRLAHDAGRRNVRVAEQSGEVLGGLPRDRLSDDLGCGRTYPSQRLELAVLHEPGKLAIRQPANNLSSTPKSADAVGRSPRPLQLEGDLPQCPVRLHSDRYTGPLEPDQILRPLTGRPER